MRRRAALAGLLLGIALLFVALWVPHVSRPGNRPLGCPQGCATRVERAPGPLRVVTLNVLHEFPRFTHLVRRLDLIAAELRRLDADVVLLQEVPWTPRTGYAFQRLANALGFNSVYFRANGNRWTILFEEGEVILSRFPLHNLAYAELRPQAGFFEHRVVLKATALTPWGLIDVYSTHLTNGAEAVNARQAEHLLAFVTATARHPAVVGGDFNAEEGEPHMHRLTAVWTDAYRVVHPDDPGFTCCVDDLTGATAALRKRIDYIFLVPGPAAGWDVVGARRVFERPFPTEMGQLWASDHLGVLVEVVPHRR